MFLSARPGVTPQTREVKRTGKRCTYILACIRETQETKRVRFRQLLKPRVSADRHLSFLFSFLTSLLHCSIVDKSWCARMCTDPTWGELHQEEKSSRSAVCADADSSSLSSWLFRFHCRACQSLPGPQTQLCILNLPPYSSSHHNDILQHKQSDGKSPVITWIWGQQKDIF